MKAKAKIGISMIESESNRRLIFEQKSKAAQVIVFCRRCKNPIKHCVCKD